MESSLSAKIVVPYRASHRNRNWYLFTFSEDIVKERVASLRRLPNSPYWIACFTLPDGRQTQRSTKEKDRDKALRLALKFEDTAKTARAGHLTESHARKIVSDIYGMVNPAALTSSTIRHFLTNWLTSKEKEAGVSTHRRYSVTVNQFIKFLGSKADQDLAHLSLKDIHVRLLRIDGRGNGRTMKSPAHESNSDQTDLS